MALNAAAAAAAGPTRPGVSKASLERFSDAWRAFLASNGDAVRVRNIEAGLQLGPHVVELTVTYLADTSPDMLRDPAVVQELTDMMTRWILKDPAIA